MPEKRAGTRTKRSVATQTTTEELDVLRKRIVELESAEADRERALKVRDALYRIADAATAVEDMAAFYPAIHRIVGELMFAENFYIALYDEERQTMNYPYMVDQVDTAIDPTVWHPIGTGWARGTTAYVLRTGTPVLLPKARYEELIALGEVERQGADGEDWLGVPLQSEGKTIGVLVVQSYETVHRYSDADVDLLAFVGQHVATALSRARAMEETRERNAELAIINEIGTALAGELDMAAMYELVGDRVRDLFQARDMFIATYDRDTNLISWPYEIENGERYHTEPFEFGPGLTSIVIRTGKALRLGTNAEAVALGMITIGPDSSSWLGVPMLGADGVTGVIALESVASNAYGEADERLLRTLASNLGVALEGARLLDQTRQRNAELAVVNSVQAGLAAELDMQAMYDLVGDKIAEIFDTQVVDIGIYDADADLIHFPYTIERGVRFPDEPVAPFGFRRHVLATGQPLLIDDLERQAAEYGNPTTAFQGESAKSLVFAPLMSGGQPIGVVSLQNLDRQRAFGRAEMDLLATLTASLGVALENARLIDETRRRAAELTIVNEIGTALAGQLEMTAMYELVGDRVRDLFHVQDLSITTFDRATNLITNVYEIEAGAREHNPPFEYGPGLNSTVIRSGRPLRIGTSAEADELGAIWVGARTKSWLGVPMLGADGTFGVMSMWSVEPNAYTEADERLLGTLASNLAVALEGARLFDETRRLLAETDRRAAELAIVNSVQQGLAEQLDMQAMYDLVGDKIAEIFDTHVVDIATYDRDSDRLRFPYVIERGVRLHEEPVAPFGFRRHVLATGELLNIDDMEREAPLYGNPLTPMSGEPAKSLVFAPLVSGGTPIGVVSLQNLDRGSAFGRAETDLLNTLTASLGVALENVRLIDETRERAAELTIINEIGTALAGEVEMGAMYELVGDRVRDLFRANMMFIATYDRRTDLISFPYETEDGERLHSEPMAFGLGLTSQVIRGGRPLRIGTVEDSLAAGAILPGNLGNAQTTQTASWLGVPMLGADGVTGVIALESVETNAYSAADERLLGTLATNLGVALEGARLFDETRRLLAETDQRAAELAIVNSVGQALATHLDLDALIAQLGDQMVHTFGADLVYVALHDPETDLIEFPYYYEGGETERQEPLPFGQGLTSRILQTREPLLLNQAAQFEAIGTHGVGTAASSYLGVPITVGDTAIGVISVQSTDEVGRFGEADTRLLTTLAANVGVAIQNARLYQAQQEGERRYRRLVEELPLVLYTDKPDATSTAIYISPQVETMFGYPQASWMEEPFFESILHPDDRERVMNQTQTKIDAPDATQSFEYRLIAADGRVVWVHDDNWVVRDENGDALHVQGFMMDVTEQTLAAAEIRRQKQYFEALVEISPVAIVTMDRSEIVSGWNPAATRLFGYQPDDAIGRHIDDLLFQAAEGREEGKAATRQAAETGRAQLIGRRFRQDGEPVDVEIVVVPLVIDGEHTGYYAIYHDITELQTARAAAEEANQAKSTFLAAMSHEIRTPMNAIIGMSGLLLDTTLDDEQRDYAETITTSGEALLTIINDILDFSKIEAGRIELEASPFALGTCVEGALDVIAPLVARKGVELAYAIDPDLPAVVVGDAGRLRQIVLNLLSNAAKFTERGEIVLRVVGRRLETRRSKRGGPSRWEITVDVRDTGIGIAPDRLDRLFESFSQADVSISRKYGGTGLGLAISRRLSELMGGTLVASSSGIEGEGSAFHLTIQADAASELDLVPARSGPLPELVGRRALVVDDNATNRQIVVAQTARWGIATRDTPSPREALGWLEAGESFDVALLDLLMPELDGYALADRIRATAAGTGLPIIVLSSVGSRDREAASVAAFLTKPVKPSALHDALVTVLHGDTRAPSVRLSERPSADPELGRRHPLRILLAEDNAVNQKLAIRLLAQMGYEADVAGNGLEAIAALERRAYDVILMDVQMPELDGLDATRRIRAGSGSTSTVRIVAMTANALAGDREACLAAGMDDYVSKPIRPAELAAALAATPSDSDGGTDA